MLAEGAVGLAETAEQVTQRKVGLHRVIVHFEHADKYLNGLVRLLVEEIIEPLEVM